jgi:hypothetical protein
MKITTVVVVVVVVVCWVDREEALSMSTSIVNFFAAFSGLDFGFRWNSEDTF